jgi:hypothetical protein
MGDRCPMARCGMKCLYARSLQGLFDHGVSERRPDDLAQQTFPNACCRQRLRLARGPFAHGFVPGVSRTGNR